jgi:hypothetical protein
MDRHNWYAGRVVLDADLDETSDWIHEAFEGAALDYGFLQDDVSTGNPDEKGGILRGLAVTLDAPATDLKVDVSVGAAKDGSYQRINLATLANLTLTSYGKWAVGATSGAATISPVAINITTGQEQWASLFIKYGELTSNPKTDLTGTGVDFNIAESWQFELAVGTAAVPDATSREALDENSRVLLSDILIENPSGTHQIKTNGICGTNDELDTLGYGLDDTAALAGRRSDWIAAENPTDFPTWRSGGTQHMEIREGNPRDALWTLVKQLARQTTLSGAGIIGAPVQTGAAAAYLENKQQATTAASLESQVKQLLDILSDAMMQGGNNILQPKTTFPGMKCSVATMDSDEAMFRMQAEVGGADGLNRMFGQKRGIVSRPHQLFDDFMDIGTHAGGNLWYCQPGTTTYEPNSPWYSNKDNTNAQIVCLNAPGGVIQLQTGTTPVQNDWIYIATGLNATTPMKWWNCGAAPYAVCMFRFRIPTSHFTDMRVRFGLWSDDPASHGASAVYAEFDTSVDADELRVRIMQGGTPVAGVSMGDLTVNTWHTVRLSIRDLGGTPNCIGQLDGNAEVISGDAGGSIVDGGYTLGAYVETLNAGGSERYLDIDQAFASDGHLASDMSY